MLDVLLGEGIHNTAVVVTRYFGGTLLGTGGLVRAYSKSVQAGLAASTVLEKKKGFLLAMETDYSGIGKIQYLLGQRGLLITDSQYTDKVTVETLVPQEELVSVSDLAAEEGLETRILGELEEVNALFKANPDYLHLLSIPSIPKKERCGLLDEALRGQVHLYVLNFLKILGEKGTLRELGGCTRAYRIRYNEAHGILEATATSAIALTKEQTAALHQKLEALTGKTIDLQTKVDPAVLGGIRLDIDGTELDGTVQNRLAALRRNIAAVTL